MKKQTNTHFMLPKAMKNKLDQIDFGSEILKNKAKKLICKIITDGFYYNKDLSAFIQIPSSYFRKVYNGRYKNELLNPLIKNGIIQENPSYSSEGEDRFCKSFRIYQDWFNNSDSYVSENFTSIREGEDNDTININPETSITKLDNKYITTSLSIPYMLHQFQKASLKADFDSLYYDINRLQKVAAARSSCINFKTNDEIDATCIHVVDRIKQKEFKGMKSEILSKVKSAGYTFIEDNGKYYIDDLDRYMAAKKRSLDFFNMTSLSKLKKGIYNIGRNKTNNRLDSNFTILGKELLEVIKEDNDLVEVDLCNSQFAILADWMKKEGLNEKYDDVDLFCDVASNGTLYEHLSSISPYYMLHQFSNVKSEMMQMAFSKVTAEMSDFKRGCYRLMPNVVDFMDNYKKKNGYKEFSIELQKRESKIFIDNLLFNIKENGFFCITRHDSLLVKKPDLDQILQLMKSYFDFIGFACRVKVDKEIIEWSPANANVISKNDVGFIM